MLMPLQIAAWTGQVVILLGIVVLATMGSRTMFQRLLSPACWIAFFYTLWFLVPQLVSISNNNFVIGFPEADGRAVLMSQVYLCVFLISVWTGFLIVRCVIDTGSRSAAAFAPLRLLDERDKWILGVFYAVGLLATGYLGLKYMGGEGARSVLVKSPVGIVMMTLSYFAIFAMAVILGHAVSSRRYVIGVLTLLALGSAIFFTGARGRLLWPIAMAVVFTWMRSDRINLRFVLVFVVLGVFTLMLFDPLLAMVRTDPQDVDYDQLEERVSIAHLFLVKRNFDGFANFTMIVNRDWAAYDPRVYLTGGRLSFMYTYFPEVWKQGVGFGTTIPGMCWLGGGAWGLIGGGMGYGLLMGMFNFLMKRIRDEPLMWGLRFRDELDVCRRGEFSRVSRQGICCRVSGAGLGAADSQALGAERCGRDLPAE
ncbi:MAG: hypothetical protein AAGD07_01930 [Planctomycetota bacterium]